MPLNSFSNYPNGFTHGLTVRGVSVLNSHFGNIWWVDSGTGSDSGGADGSITKPFATVDYAIGRCTANNGDLILLAPGHAETLVVASAVAQDVAGVAIRGIGQGNDRPTFTFTPAAVGTNPWAISAANCSVENIICKPGLDAITNPFNVSAAAAYIDIEWQDASSTIEAETVVLTTAAADNLNIDLKYLGFTAGDACVAPIKLVGCTDGRINVDFHGKASTSIVNFITTLSTNINVTGYAYNSGTTDGSKLVVDTIGSSTWYSEIYDGAAGAKFSGGSGAAIASDDVTAVNTVLGTVATAAATGAVTSTDNLMAYIKQLVTQNGIELDTNTLGSILYGTGGIATFPAAAIPGDAVSLAEVIRQLYAALEGTAANQNGVATWPTAAAYANNVSIAEVLGYIQDAVRRGTGTTLPANTSLADYAEAVITTAAAVIAAGTATIFTVAGGPIEVQSLVSVCVTGNDGTATLLKYTADPTDGAATDLSIASASLASATAGTTALVTGTFANAPTISANGVVAAGTTKFIVTAGVIQTITTGGATTGTWTHHLRYKPLAKGVTVT